jgi:DNA-binding transcriptional MocR family regulator
MWCVPVFSNPQGIVYSDNCIKALAALQPAAADFRIFWDNAYIVHAFEGEPPIPANLLRECEKAGNYDMPIMFSSFSKISFPGAGVTAMSASPANLDLMRKHLSIKTIGPDKLNQLRHVKYYKDADGVREHMKKSRRAACPKV